MCNGYTDGWARDLVARNNFDFGGVPMEIIDIGETIANAEQTLQELRTRGPYDQGGVWTREQARQTWQTDCDLTQGYIDVCRRNPGYDVLRSLQMITHSNQASLRDYYSGGQG